MIEAVYFMVTAGPPRLIKEHAWTIFKTAVTLLLIFLIKAWTSGASTLADRKMHGKVVMVTGGTTGIGAQVVSELAKRGAQIVLLTHAPVTDPFLDEYINDLRDQTGNQMIYAEQVDLSSLHSIRQFATKWIDNAPPRRLDTLILNAATVTPPGFEKRLTEEGIEETWMINYLANFHLLSILSPALRAQPFDRDLRIVITTCASYIGSPPLSEPLSDKNWSPSKAYRRSKLALMTFGQAFQKHLDEYKRPDQLPMNARVFFVDPGYSRTPGMRRWLTRGTLWGLLLYVTHYALPWLLLKSPYKGAQSVLHAVMDSELGRIPGGKFIKECMMVDYARKDIHDLDAAKKLWEESDKLIEKVEKEQALLRAKNKKSAEEKAKQAEDEERSKDVEELVSAIKKGKQAQKEQAQKDKSSKKKAKKAQ